MIFRSSGITQHHQRRMTMTFHSLSTRLLLRFRNWLQLERLQRLMT
jgi:hypothetical protein